MSSIDNMIRMRVSTKLGFQFYVKSMEVCNKRDAAIMSVRSGAKHSTNPQHYYKLSLIHRQVTVA